MVETEVCDHSTVSAGDAVQFFECCHRYKRGDKYLTSVSKVIREVWPDKPSWEGVDMAVVENARERGVECDDLFSRWINGTLDNMNGYRQDAVDRFTALTAFWSNEPKPPARAQIILADHSIAGTADLIIGGGEWDAEIWDVKNTSKIEATYSFQVGAYCELYKEQYGVLPKRAGVLHVTQPKGGQARVREVKYSIETIVSEWRLLREYYTMVQRKRLMTR